MKLFSELGGFIVFSPERLDSFCKQKQIKNDIMSFLTNDESADIITAEGVATPLLNLEPDDYQIEVILDFEQKCSEKKLSTGWVFNSEGTLCICGAGYFFDYDYDRLVSIGKIFEIKIDKGWYSMHFSLPEKDVLRVSLKHEHIPPNFSGDFCFDFYS